MAAKNVKKEKKKMRKILLLVAILVACTIIHATNYQLSGYSQNKSGSSSRDGLIIQANLGLDLLGNHELSGIEDEGITVSYDVNTGISANIEVMKQRANFLYGAGLEFQLPREIDISWGSPSFNFIPIYLTGRYKLPVELPLETEGILQLGYNFFSYNDDYSSDEEDEDYSYKSEGSGGMYWGFGLGALYNTKFVFQLMYKVNKAKLDITEEDYYYDDYEKYDYTTKIRNSQWQFSVGYRF